MALLYILYGNPYGLAALGVGISLITAGVQMKRASLLSLGIFTVLLPSIFISLLASSFSGGADNKTKTIVASSSSVIILIAFLITRRF